MNVVLMGLRGSGKSTVGARAAAQLGRAFVDLDLVTPTFLMESSVARAWAARGEVAFRRAEADALRLVLDRDDQIIALGGGTPTAPGAAELLRRHRTQGLARVIYLRGHADTLRAHLAGADNTQRPSLTGGDPLAEVEAVLAARDPLYVSLADLCVTIDAKSLDDVARELDVAIRAIGLG